ncbi:MAG: response regulator, partial [Campylobacterales bacterium]|nr:response regulator [Campylobacterales bacterium]
FEVYLEKKPDIVITDILMPRLDGLKLSKEIKNISNETKIIISSAYSDTKYLLEAIEIGVFGYIIKPYNKQQIDDILIKCSDSISYEKNWKSINKK